MCGRFSLWSDKTKLIEHFDLTDTPDFKSVDKYGVHSSIPVVRQMEARELVLCQWWLVPHWSKERKYKAKTFNARAETIDSLPSFRTPWKKGRRCLIPANGFYERDTINNDEGYYFISLPPTRKEKYPLFALAGIWDLWEKESPPLLSCSMITTDPNEQVGEVHHTMPVILEPSQYDTWLHHGTKDILQSYSGELVITPA